jgi:hypothetical protein
MVKQINFRPLIEIGFSEKLLKSLVFLLLPQIQQDLIMEMEEAFTEKEKKDLYKRGKKYQAGSEEQGKFLIGEYRKKTGNKLEDKVIERLQAYLDMVREVMEKSAQKLALVGEMSEADVIKLKGLLEQGDFDQVNRFFDFYQEKGD